MATGSARSLLPRLLLASLAVLFSLAVIEGALRFTKKRPPPGRLPPLVACGPCPEILELNPKRTDVSSEGLRDREFSPEAPEGTLRIMVVGDSVSFGYLFRPEQSFPKVLERELNASYGPVEVINASVPTYTAYNELQYYLAKGRSLHPKVVLISLCLNDVVDPSLHWARFLPPQVLDALPAAAIPNPAYHEEQAVHLRAERERQARSMEHGFRRLELYRRLFPSEKDPDDSVVVDGRRFPVFVTGEENQTLMPLMDYESTEWRWLRGVYDAFVEAIRADGASPAIVVHPLAYQLDPGYPFFPQRLLERYCRERSIPCLDPLPALRQGRGKDLFVGKSGEIRPVDIWHYTPEGSAAVADAIAAFLRTAQLLPPRGAP